MDQKNLTNLFNAAVDKDPEAVIIIDSKGIIKEFNNTAARLIDIPAGKKLSLKDYKFFRIDNSPMAGDDQPWYTAAKQNSEVDFYNIGLSKAYGQTSWFSGSAKPLLSSDGLSSRVLISLKESKPFSTIEVLRDSELKYRTLFENITEEVHFWKIVRNADGTIKTWSMVDANPPALKTWGINSAADIRGKTADEIFGAGSTEHYMPVVLKIFSDGTPYSYEDYFPNLDKYFSFTSIPLGEYFITTGTDVSKFKKLERNADRERNELKAIFESAHDSMLVFNMAGDIVMANNAFLTRNNIKSITMLARNVDELNCMFQLSTVDGKKMKMEEWPVYRILRGETLSDETYKVVRKDGKEMYLNFNGSPIYDEDYVQILALLIARDVTQNYLDQLAIKESEKRFHTLADNISPLVWMSDNKGVNLWVNKRFIEYTGMDDEELYRSMDKLHHPDFVQKAQEKFAECIREEKVFEDVFPLKGKDGNYRWFLRRAVPVKDEEGKITHWFGTNEDITEQKNLMEQLRLNQEKFQKAESLAHHGSFFHDLNSGIIDGSDEFWKILGIDAIANKVKWDEIIKKIHPEDFISLSNNRDVNNPHKPFESEVRILNDDGSVKYIYLYDAAEADENGNIIIRYGAILDITERVITRLKLQKVLEELETSRAKLLTSQKMAKMGNVEFDVLTGKPYWSEEVFDIYERPLELGNPSYSEAMNYIHNDDRESALESIRNLKQGDTLSMDYRIMLPGGRIKYLNYFVTPVFEGDIQVRRYGTIQDITDRKMMEVRLQEAYTELQERLTEKEILLRELYHRTKNNMQIISSLLNLRSVTIANPVDREIFLEMKNRIQAMSLVHERLYQSNNLSKLNLGAYVHDLVELLLVSHAQSRDHIKVHYDLCDAQVLIDSAMPCGFIITELILNVIKFAFPNNRKGNLYITMSVPEENFMEIVIADDGIGFSDEIIEKDESLGMQLVRSLTEDQLNGTAVLDKTNGVKWTIRFQEKLYNERV